ncbi:transposase, partial [Marinilactibacillus psychrotolerans]
MSYDEQLTRAYETCQLLLYHFKHKDSQSFFDTINSLDQRLPQWFCKKLTFLNKYKLGIQYALKTRYSNGALEGTNNKIKVIKRVAYGYRNFHNFRARIYLIQGLIFQVNRVGGASRLRPLTPPYVRIRIRRFNILRKQTLPFRLGILSPS